MGRLIIGMILLVSGAANLMAGSPIIGLAGIAMGVMAITQGD